MRVRMSLGNVLQLAMMLLSGVQCAKLGRIEHLCHQLKFKCRKRRTTMEQYPSELESIKEQPSGDLSRQLAVTLIYGLTKQHQ